MTSHQLRDFNFSFTLAQKAQQELESSHSILSERISNITDSEKFFINGFPVLKNILALQPNKSDLKRLAKALDRLGDLMEAFKQLDNKLSVMKTVQEDPHWFAWACGDFSKEIEQDLESFFHAEEGQ